MKPDAPPRPVVPGQARHRLGLRLTRAAVAAAGVALLVTGLVLNAFLFFSSRSALHEDMQAQARMAGDNSAAALLFGDVPTANEILASLQASSVVLSATLFDARGERFAAYQRPGVAPAAPLSDAERAAALAGPLFRDGQLVVIRPVRQDTRAVGRIELVVSLQALERRAIDFAFISAAAALLALGIAYLLAVGIRRDIDRTEARLDELAFVDPVTRLYNRHAANEHLQAMVAAARRSGAGFTLMLLDLDDFKLVNDTLGHAVGDDVLRLMAERLRAGLRLSDLVFRFGGDEFVVVCDGPVREGASERLGAAAVACLQPPLQVGRHEIYVRGSVGIAQFPNDADDAQELLRAADTAMYGAKAAGKNTYAVFHPDMAQSSHSRLRIDTELRHAIQRNELVLHYQPIVALPDGDVLGVEALVRWQHPLRGLLQPAEFIDVAESTGLIVELGAWVLDAATRQLARWQAAGLGHLYIAVNVSGRQIKRAVLLPQVQAALKASGANPRRLQIEITEHTLVEDVNASVQTLTALRDMGVRIAIDDFGTGLSSLAYLKRLPIDKFKVDRSFVRELPEAAGDAAIVTAVVSMAHALGLQVVAEGVETPAQREFLARLGCNHAQGFLFGKPAPADQLHWLPAVGEAGSVVA
ncbi:putative bifunctional diguanylate cyclase/phosphodiesterase [Ideonella sp. BN130291]|uniref:putative bifunctional diguanylate cyclase/phosphodiesterase n=1 Tax=Ideonella sp. BN130291 TaxID=3112940 RepID=UPI002E26A578|nr:EAL domain-containing protein [Ideonella sp. BN130291]